MNVLHICGNPKPTDEAVSKQLAVAFFVKLAGINPDIEVVLVSGHPSEIERLLRDFLAAGGRDDLLRKPLIKDELIEVVQKIADEKR